jgi:hypothetical protein
MRAPKILTTICCALAIATFFLVTGARADEYTKLTYLTFSAPVQVPGMTLPAGTYMFKLADPDSGRRAIQIWDEKGTKLFTMLLTVPDQQSEAKDDPVVMFSERPSGSAPAVKSWFYPAERTGYEFIYPREQAMKIAADSNNPVLAYNTDVKSDADEAALRGTQVGRVDAQGGAAADRNAAASTTTTSTTTTTASTAQASTAQARQEQANRTAPADPSPAAPNATTTTATRTTSRAAAPSAPATATTRPDARGAGATAVGTSGQANRAAQAPQGAQPAQRAQELPRTASSLTALQLLSVGLIVSALGVRQVRRHFAENR